MYTISPEKLLVLKVIHLGVVISERPYRRTIALDMINKSIIHIETIDGFKYKKRLLFYLLLKSEIVGVESERVELRKYAKGIDDGMGSTIYRDYIKIKRPADIYNYHKNFYDLCHSIGVNSNHLSESNLHFIYNVPLAKILDAHGIEY